MAGKRRRLAVILLLLSLLAAPLCAVLYGQWAARQLVTTRHTLPQEALPGAGPLTIALITDVHDDRGQLRQCVELVEKEKPDLIIFGGDLVLSSARLTRTRGLVGQLQRLRSIAPTYAILGNQDYEMQQQVERILATAGIPLLRNETIIWKTPGGAHLHITGLGDWNEGDEAPTRCLPPRGQAGAPILLLSHDPESRHLLQDYAWDLMLSGHTHGGQLGIPFTHEPICLRSDMPAGHYEENGRHHIVSRGLGAIYGIRFFCPAELVVVQVGGGAADR